MPAQPDDEAPRSEQPLPPAPEAPPDEERHGTPSSPASITERDPLTRIIALQGDETVIMLQLAARWSELYAPTRNDSLELALQRFRRAYAYLDAVSHGVEPDELG